MKIGLGIDTHSFIEGNNFKLGGIEIKYNKAIKAHSDGDVLIHSIIDALLGAANLGDIGHLFPDTNKKYKNIDSKILLKKVSKLLVYQNYKIENIDTVIILQEPNIAEYIHKMKITISKLLSITEKQISIKATTTEGLGFEGVEDGVSAQAISLIFNTGK